MNENFARPAGLALAALLMVGLAIWHGLRPRARKRATVVVSSAAKSILAPKATVLTELLHRRMATRGIATFQTADAMAHQTEVETADGEAAMLASARAVGADYGLVVSLDDLNCQVDEFRVRDIAQLRVNTTLCVAYRLFEIGPGRLLAGQTLAFCRRTSPIVNGTAVGSDVLDGLMREVADRIDQQMESLHLPA
jgi:hypothetical protein